MQCGTSMVVKFNVKDLIYMPCRNTLLLVTDVYCAYTEINSQIIVRHAMLTFGLLSPQLRKLILVAHVAAVEYAHYYHCCKKRKSKARNHHSSSLHFLSSSRFGTWWCEWWGRPIRKLNYFVIVIAVLQHYVQY